VNYLTDTRTAWAVLRIIRLEILYQQKRTRLGLNMKQLRSWGLEPLTGVGERGDGAPRWILRSRCTEYGVCTYAC
jgi:hypothetical protein